MHNITSLSLLTLISYRLGMMSVLDNHRLIDSLKVIQWFRFGDAMGPAISKTKEQNHESYIKNRTSHDAVNWFCHLKKNSPAPVKSCLKKWSSNLHKALLAVTLAFYLGFWNTVLPYRRCRYRIRNAENSEYRIPFDHLLVIIHHPVFSFSTQCTFDNYVTM